MQYIASWQSEIEDPNTSEERRKEVKNGLQAWESIIQDYKRQLDKCVKQIIGESII